MSRLAAVIIAAMAAISDMMASWPHTRQMRSNGTCSMGRPGDQRLAGRPGGERLACSFRLAKPPAESGEILIGKDRVLAYGSGELAGRAQFGVPGRR